MSSDSNRVKISDRLERLPSSSYVFNLAVVLLIAILFTVFVNNGFSYLMPSIAKEFKLDPIALGKLASVSFWGMIVGALVGGFLSDKIGRKPVTLMAMAIWGVAGVIMSFAPSVVVIEICRLLIGFALGAHLPTAQVAMSELVPSRLRGKYMVSYILALPIGMALVGLLTYFLLPVGGWKIVALIEGIVALWAIAYWRFFPESPLWLETQGRYAEADQVMDVIEAGVQKSTGQPLPPVEVKPVQAAAPQGPETQGSIFSKSYIGLLVLMAVYMLCQMMGFYGIGMWLSALLVAKGFAITKAVLYVSLISLGGVPAFFMMGYLVDKVGRKWSVVIMAVTTAITAYLYGQAPTLAWVIGTGLLYMFMQFGYNMASGVFTVEQWPTKLRGAGKGYTQAWGRVGSSLGPIIIGYIVAASHNNISMVMLFAVGINLFAALVILLFAAETKGKVF
ncbi:MAG: MFS transporter [Firmicutes bacterium]|nr:MFS transporter [Bacillota bacterium]